MPLSLGIVLATTVAVDLSALDGAAWARLDADRLHAQLVVRLAEEGYAVRAPSQPTGYRIELRMASARRVRIRAIGAGERSEELAVGPRRVLHLAVTQRALVLLEDLPPAPVSEGSAARVFLHFPSRSDDEAANRLYGGVALEVIRRGFVLVGAAGPTVRQVCVSPAGEPVWLEGGAPDRCAGSEIGDEIAGSEAPRDQPVRESFRERLVETMASLESAVRSRPRRTPSSSSPGGRPAPAHVEFAREASEVAPGPIFWTLGASAGAVVRRSYSGTETHPGAALTLRAGRTAGLCGAATARSSYGEVGGFQVLSIAAAAGPGWCVGSGAISFGAFFLVGATLHRDGYSGKALAGSWSWTLLAPLDLSVRVADSWRVHLIGVAGIVEDNAIQVNEDDLTLWRNDRIAALEAGASVTF